MPLVVLKLLDGRTDRKSGDYNAYPFGEHNKIRYVGFLLAYLSIKSGCKVPKCPMIVYIWSHTQLFTHDT